MRLSFVRNICTLFAILVLTACVAPVGPNGITGTLNILDTWNVEQKSDMYIMVFNGAGVAVVQGYNQIVQDILSGPYIAKFYGRANDGKIYTSDWNLCFTSNIQVDAGKVNQYKTNGGCTGKKVP